MIKFRSLNIIWKNKKTFIIIKMYCCRCCCHILLVLEVFLKHNNKFYVYVFYFGGNGKFISNFSDDFFFFSEQKQLLFYRKYINYQQQHKFKEHNLQQTTPKEPSLIVCIFLISFISSLWQHKIHNKKLVQCLVYCDLWSSRLPYNVYHYFFMFKKTTRFTKET